MTERDSGRSRDSYSDQDEEAFRAAVLAAVRATRRVRLWGTVS
jgi:hypothetical protein